jgi:hypothetical protein
MASALGEGVALWVVAGVVGMLPGVAAAQRMLVPTISSFLASVYAPAALVRASGTAVGRHDATQGGHCYGR